MIAFSSSSPRGGFTGGSVAPIAKGPTVTNTVARAPLAPTNIARPVLLSSSSPPAPAAPIASPVVGRGGYSVPTKTSGGISPLRPTNLASHLPTLQPAGGSLATQPAGSPPSGAPASISLVTSAGGVSGMMADLSATPAIALGSFSIPQGWLLLGGVVAIAAYMVWKKG